MGRVRYPAGGWLPPGAHFDWQRSDQGRDFVTNWQGVIQAPGNGVCVNVGSDRSFPSGFGPAYPWVKITSGEFKGHTYYIGHCTAAIHVGRAFCFGDVLAHADQGHNFEGTDGGWVELGEVQPGGVLGPNSSTGHWFDPLLRKDFVVRTPMPILRLGAKGPKVLLFTGRLVKLGYLDRRWWHFNDHVELAVKAFQKDRHLKADGIVGHVTWHAIHRAVANKPHPTKPVRHQRPAFGVSTRAVEKIAGFEGGQSNDGLFHPYRDPVGVWTIGYGHTKGVTAKSKPLTKAEALALLHEDLNRVYVPEVLAAARGFNWLPLSQAELDALVSFCYNLGSLYFEPSHTLGAALQKHDLKAAAAAILLYDKAGGSTLPGLVIRRTWEHDRFLGAPA